MSPRTRSRQLTVLMSNFNKLHGKRKLKIFLLKKIIEILQDEESAFLLKNKDFRNMLRQKLNQFYFKGSVLEASSWYKDFFGIDIGESSPVILPQEDPIF